MRNRRVNDISLRREGTLCEVSDLATAIASMSVCVFTQASNRYQLFEAVYKGKQALVRACEAHTSNRSDEKRDRRF
jgi:hypothetical protein